MAHGTGVAPDIEVPKGAQMEQDTDEVIDWKAQRAVEQARMQIITTRIDLLGKLSPKTKDGQSDKDRVIALLQKEVALCKAKADFYNELVEYAHELRRIRSILGGK